MFCGINPGYKSAEDGHHFAHGTNHFWPCLYRSGLTSRLLSPTEDYTLPESFSLGLTNLVDRPSAEQAELSKAEESAAAPALLRRISRFRPRIVCFVGMGIWTSVEGVIRKTAPRAPRQASASSPAPGKEKTRLGLQPYKMVHTTNDATMSVRETLFFVVPSTSGRVQRYQLPQKVEFFASLKASLEDAKSATLDTSYMTVVAEALLTKE
ncbi:hypothetical protein PLICRDRAFT_505997 [Plicaturopsis crispa FD-325 SS-3]|nr:hypothetical protein PLICRDRAFT_505997 [Plicaturopsis crispa FD-325 SS-3]